MSGNFAMGEGVRSDRAMVVPEIFKRVLLMTRNSFISGAAISSVVALATLLAGCEKEKPPQAGPPVVEVVPVVQKDVPIYREWVGTLEGDVNAAISAQVTGYLQSRQYVEGSYVTNGQVLFQIDPGPFQAALDKAQSELAQSQALQEKWALTVSRYRPLAKLEAISQQELDDAVQNERAAAANVLAAKAAVESAALNLGFTTIKSPVDGMAGLASAAAQVGNLVGPNSGTLTTVSTIEPIRAYASVSQRLVTEFREQRLKQGLSVDPSEGMSLQLILATGSVYPEPGRLRFKNNQVDVKTGTVRVVGEFPNPQHLLIPGMFVNIRALLTTLTNAMLVPQRAVTEMQGRYLVATVGADDKVSIHPVQATDRIGQDWVIQGPIKAGDKIIAEGVQKIREGAVVKPVPYQDKPPAVATTPAQPPEEKKK